MFTRPQLNSVTRHISRRQSQRGQSIVVALLVLLLLGLAGALFVTVVARNLINANKSNRVQAANQYAAAGITYADSQLSSSIDGADWRPPLQVQLAVPPTEARELARYTAAVAANSLPVVNASDPDAEYLQAGYARYNTGAGRYLVRVTYTPIVEKDTQGQLYDPVIGTDAHGIAIAPVAVPPGKYLKIESIGRGGNIDPMDPTTYGNNRSSDRTQSYLVAYKPIGITDYARFETNPDKRSDIANLGVVSQFYAANPDGGIATPGVSDFNTQGSTSANGTTAPTIQEYPVITTYGAVDAYLKATASPNNLYPNSNAGSGQANPPTNFTYVAGGGSIHSNMSVRFFGTNVMYLNPTASSPLFQDTAEIGGDLLLDSYNNANPLFTTSSTATAGQQAALILNPTSLSNPTSGVSSTQPNNAPTSAYIAPSNSTTQTNGTFDTHGGLIRDGSMQNDPEGLPRSITRLEPPLVDAQDNASQMPRYRAIAMNSAPRTYTNAAGTAATYPAGSAQYGYGKAIYVNNPDDLQKDSTTIGGGSTLTDEWLHRTAANSTGTNKGDWNGLFYNPPGATIVLGQEITPPVNANTAGTFGVRLTRTDDFVGPDGTTDAGHDLNVPYSNLDTDPTGAASDNDIVIYAEGNVRVRGIASPNEGTDNTTHQKYVPRHITIVTGGTAYIEGNLLKGTPDSSISVLAHDYVCINTTQFLAGTVQGEQRHIPADNPSIELTADNYVFTQQFGFGFTNPGATTPQTPSVQYGTGKLALYVAAGSPLGPSQLDFNILDSTGTTVLTPPPTSPPTPPVLPLPTLASPLHFTYDLSSLSNNTLASLTSATGDSVFQLMVQKDPGNIAAFGNSPGSDTTAVNDPLLERVAILPMDIRIEAVLYAQTGSFFVIPGDWFNTNPPDNLDSFHKSFGPGPSPEILVDPVNGTRPDLSGIAPGSPDYISRSRFPMYGQPVDLKITIDGSVSEAHPADIAAQTAWMQHWGWIPQYHGSLVTSSQAGGASTGTETAGHTLSGQPAIGLQIIYDPQAGYPYDPAPTGTNNLTPYYLRSDAFGRPLPFTPKLPVSTGLLYSGQSGEAPLLQ